ncbi:MAG: SGNH/GDSL hydrolase family protein [Pseudomonadota bacterium]
MRTQFLGVGLALCSAMAQAQSVQVIGDSILVWNSWKDASIADFLIDDFGEGVSKDAAAGAYLTNPSALGRLFGFDIRLQYEPRAWDWLVLDGGGNDLLSECSCGACETVLDDLSSDDGRRGAMPDLVNEIRDTGTQVVLLGYFMPSVAGGPAASCAPELRVLNARYQAIADRDVDVYFVNAAALIARDDLSLFDADLLHPSIAGSQILADAIADIIREN